MSEEPEEKTTQGDTLHGASAPIESEHQHEQQPNADPAPAAPEEQ